MKATGKKYRHEYKYVISNEQMAVLKAKISGLMTLDSNVQDGKYNIRSLYFDNYDNKCYYENENSEEPRQKYRIRTYNASSDLIKLEIKRKERGKIIKFSSNLDIEQTKQFIKGNNLRNLSNDEVLENFNTKIMTELYHPVIIVEYTRTPYIYKLGNVRVTFDTNITSSKDINKFLDKNIRKRPIMPAGMQLMEVKFDEYLPDVIFKTLQMDRLHLTTFSKYYLCRKYSL